MQQRFINLYVEGIYLNMKSYIVHANIENIHWTLVIVNFKEKSIKYLDGKKLDGT